jgi:hypothetical protein
MSRRSNPTRQIELRQRQEDLTSNYTNVAAEHSQLKMKSQWEEKTSSRIQRNELFRRMDEVQARQADVLQARRQRLSELLIKEKAVHDSMIANLAETDDQRRERLMQQARELRERREQLRQQEASARRDQIFREESALIREAQSKLKVLRAAADRESHLEALKARKAQEEEEERFFSEQWLDQQAKQAARTQSDMDAIHRKREQLKHDLQLQIKAAEKRAQQAQEAQAKEDAEFLELVRQGKAADANAEAKRKMRQKQLAEETKIRNEELRRMKEEEKTMLAEEEKRNLDELLAQIAADEASERQKKKEAREHAMSQIKFVEAQMNTVAENETALDRLWQEESDKEWAKREDRWLEEQARREALLHDVFSTRKNQILELRQKELDEAQRKRAEHDAMIVETTALAHRDTSDVRKKKEAALAIQQYQLQQVEARNKEKNDARAAKKFEMTSAQAVEHEYQKKISEELAKLEQGKPERYQGVKLAAQRRGISGLNA